MVDTFCQVALCPVTDIIAHPFDPTAADFQQPEMLREIFMHLPHQQLIYCFSMAAKQQKVIEINLGSFVHGVKNELYRQTYLPMFAAAKEAGCKFCLASDAQKPEDLQQDLSRKCGISDRRVETDGGRFCTSKSGIKIAFIYLYNYLNSDCTHWKRKGEDALASSPFVPCG